MKIRYLICFFIIFCFPAHSQDMLHDSASLNVKISVGGDYNSGNFRKLGLVNNADVTMNSRNDRLGLESQNQFVYTKTFGIVAENNLLTRTLFYHTFKSRWSVLGIFWFETNKLRQIKPLIQTGGALRYAWLLNSKSVGTVSLGTTYEHKRFLSQTFSDAQYNGHSDINTPRLFLRVAGKNNIGISNIAFNYDLYYMPSLQYSRNYRYHAEASLSIPVIKHLNIQTGFQYNYENVVIAGIKPDDFFTSYGISIVF